MFNVELGEPPGAQEPRLLLRPQDHVLVVGCRGGSRASRLRSPNGRCACFAVAHRLSSCIAIYRALAPAPANLLSAAPSRKNVGERPVASRTNVRTTNCKPGVSLRGATLRALRPRMEQPHGEENYWLHQTASAGRRGQSVAADRPRARPARPEHHGILQGLQCAHRAIGEGRADPGRHHRLPGPLVHLRDAPAAGDLLLEEGGEPQDRQEAGLRRQDARAAASSAR